jgi:putative flippase GtrA
MVKKLISFYKAHQEPINYLFFGALTTLVNWCSYSLLVRFAGFTITVSNVIAWVVAVIFAFLTNKMWVFKSRSWQPLVVLREGGSFLGARIITALVEIAGVPAIFHLGINYPLFGIEGFLAKVIISVIVIILNYILSKVFIFRQKKE